MRQYLDLLHKDIASTKDEVKAMQAEHVLVANHREALEAKLAQLKDAAEKTDVFLEGQVLVGLRIHVRASGDRSLALADASTARATPRRRGHVGAAPSRALTRAGFPLRIVKSHLLLAASPRFAASQAGQSSGGE